MPKYLKPVGHLDAHLTARNRILDHLEDLVLLALAGSVGYEPGLDLSPDSPLHERNQRLQHGLGDSAGRLSFKQLQPRILFLGPGHQVFDENSPLTAARP